ncbi:unnamed protein product, partial [Didymodactylos carnosus]
DDNELMVLKLDCINHVKKRVISRLKDIKSRNTGFQGVLRDVASTSTTVPVAHNTKKMKTDQSSCTIDKGRQAREVVRMKKTVPDGKPFRGSAGRMTDAMMHKMSEMYGLAIRQGTDEVQDKNTEDEAEVVARLQKKCLAAFHHFIVQDNKENQHYYCPDGMTGWCSTAAAASVYFNGGRASLLEFFEQSGIEIDEEFYLNLVARDDKRIRRAEQTAEQRKKLTLQKNKQRLQSMQATHLNMDLVYFDSIRHTSMQGNITTTFSIQENPLIHVF